MNDLTALTRRYCDAVAKEWERLRKEDPAVLLLDVFVLLPAVRASRPREELPPEEQRLAAALGEEGAAAEAPGRRGRRPEALTEEVRISSEPPVALAEAMRRHPYLVLLGEPGAGKTTTLQYLAWVFATCQAPSRLGLAEDRVPVLLYLNKAWETLSGGVPPRLLHALADEVAERLQIKPTEAWPLVEAWRDGGRLLVLLDGLDEVAGEEERRRVLEAVENFVRAGRTSSPPPAASPSPGGRGGGGGPEGAGGGGEVNRLLLTSRPTGYRARGDPWGEYFIRPLTEEGAVVDLVARWLRAFSRDGMMEKAARATAERLWNEVQAHPPVRQLLTTPLAWRMMARIRAGNPQAPLPANRASLYEQYWQALCLQRLKEGETIGQTVLRVAEGLAWAMHPQGSLAGREAEKRVQEAEPELEERVVREGLETLHRRLGAVARLGEDLVFAHATMREYFVARRLVRAWRARPRETRRFIRRRLHLPAWQEVWHLLVGLLEPREAGVFLRWVERAGSPYEDHLHRDRILSLRLWAAGGQVERALPVLERALRNRSGDVRWAAAEALGMIGDPRAVEPLLAALRDEDVDVRRAAAEALGKIGDARAVEPLIAALKDKNWRVRRAAAEVLGEIGDARAVEPLIAALKDKDEDVRRAAAEALGMIGDARAVEPLIVALKDKDEDVRRAAAGALGWIGEPAVVPLLAALKDVAVHREAAEALRKIGEPAVALLLAALKDEDWDVRRAAVWALGMIGDVRAVEPLIAALKDEDWDVRRAAVWALGMIGDARAVEPLSAALKDEVEHVRYAAAEVLGEIGDARAVEPLIAALKDKDEDVRWAAAWALGEIGDARAVEPLIVALKDGNENVRWAAAVALRRIGDARAVEPLSAALQDDNWLVRQAAAEALGEIGDARAVAPLITALKDWWVRRAAAEALGRIGDGRAVEPLIAALKDEDRDVRQAAEEALRKIGDQRAVEPLIAALKDVDKDVRRAAAEALGEIGDARAVEPLIAALKDKSDNVRWAAAEALGEIGDARAVEPLIAALKDKSDNVRWAAAGALGKLLSKWEEVRARQDPLQDPLHPPPPPRWRTWARDGLVGLGAVGLLALGMLLAALLPPFQHAVNELVKPWLASRPLWLLLLGVVAVGLAAAGLSALGRALWRRRHR